MAQPTPSAPEPLDEGGLADEPAVLEEGGGSPPPPVAPKAGTYRPEDDIWPPPLLRRDAAGRPTTAARPGKSDAGKVDEKMLFGLLGWAFVLVVVFVVIEPFEIARRLWGTPAIGDVSPGYARLGVIAIVLVVATLAFLGARAVLRLRDDD